MPHVLASRLVDLDPLTLYRLLRLRVDVFVVEQECAYPELDGVDAEPTTEHLWIEADGAPVATLRTFVDADGQHHLGRVATDAAHRGRGYAAALITEALRRTGGEPVEIGAQTYLEDWYAGFGFRRSGPDYVEDGIPHLPMRSEARGG
ncbi:GNAT family N-acetyltransferase [Ornithinimicrobium avium]|uniref:GNAT family N-acetyltransferase n=1 Tax=Ornithinimicrobium avium TaxID=2283195 RepID=A0A345NMG4_9MICO|nr:GNAT family N-acetyltransferase [Ornithinimicrobium avium]AXH96222.1 GNAT family N-acetyltransferase [Ornithinimicrobium avium]